MFNVNYLTALYALTDRGRLQHGETVFVLGAAGGVGVAAIQVARALGARVIGAASSSAKRELVLRAGASDAIDSSAADWREQLRTITEGRGVDIVIDPVGGEFSEKAFRSLAWNGRHLVIGFTAGSIPKLGSNLALLKGASLIGVDVRQFREREPERTRAQLHRLFELHASGALQPLIGATFAFDDFRAAMRAAVDRATVGRVVIEIG